MGVRRLSSDVMCKDIMNKICETCRYYKPDFGIVWYVGVFKFWGKSKISSFKTAQGVFARAYFQVLATREMRPRYSRPDANAPWYVLAIDRSLGLK